MFGSGAVIGMVVIVKKQRLILQDLQARVEFCAVAAGTDLRQTAACRLAITLHPMVATATSVSVSS